jgi:hypothetical protein
VTAVGGEWRAVYDLVGLPMTANNVAIVQAWTARRIADLVDVPETQQAGLDWFCTVRGTALLLKQYRLPFEQPAFTTRVQTLCANLSSKHVQVLDLYDLEYDLEKLEYWNAKLGPELFARLVGTESVAARITDLAFKAALHDWLADLGPELFVRLVATGSVAARITDPSFLVAIEPFYNLLDLAQFVRLVGKDSVAARITDHLFQAALHDWLADLGPELFVRLVGTDSVAKRITAPSFLIAIESFYSLLDPAQFVRPNSSGSWAKIRSRRASLIIYFRPPSMTGWRISAQNFLFNSLAQTRSRNVLPLLPF